MILESEALWVAATNCYVLASERGGLAVVVDAPPDPSGIASLLAANDLTPIALLVTHGHVDHAGGAGRFVESSGVSAYVHPDDDFLTLHPEEQIRRLFGPGFATGETDDYAPPARFEALADGLSLELGGMTIEVLHTPGHTPGHCCFYVPNEGLLFSGDQLFAGSIGRTDLPGGDHDELMRSMEQKVLQLDAGTAVFPGHGPATTLERELLVNPFLQEFGRR